MAIFDNLPFFALKMSKKVFLNTFPYPCPAKIQRNTENV